MNLPGLPEGVECVRIGFAGADDFEIQNDPTNAEPPVILKGGRGDSSSQVVVRPAKGWTFVPWFDIKTYRQIWTPSKLLEVPEETVVRFKATTEFEQKRIAQAVEDSKMVPGFVPE